MDSSSRPLVLVVDDSADTRDIVERWLTTAGFEVRALADAESLLEALSTCIPSVICLDLGLPGIGGMEALTIVHSRLRSVPVIILTGETAVGSVVQAIQEGAYDYITKPPNRNKLVTAVRNASEHHEMSRRVLDLEREASGKGQGGMIGASDSMKRMFRLLGKIAASDISVLIHGESGTGKELIAKAIHDDSARSSGPFVAVNCAAVPETLQDSEFFGHEKGAFTGASQSRAGRFEQAHGGTLFLDEVAELSASLQAKLLRVIQERQFERVGGNKSQQSDFRLVAASHCDLAEMAREGRFREDLYYRIAVLELDVPPLRARSGDIALLVRHALEKESASRKEELVMEPKALDALHAYDWPGNVRELLNVIKRAGVVCEDSTIVLDDLPRRVNENTATRASGVDEPPSGEGGRCMTLEELERWAIEKAMKDTDGDIAEVTKRLQIGRTTLYRKLKQYGHNTD